MYVSSVPLDLAGNAEDALSWVSLMLRMRSDAYHQDDDDEEEHDEEHHDENDEDDDENDDDDHEHDDGRK